MPYRNSSITVGIITALFAFTTFSCTQQTSKQTSESNSSKSSSSSMQVIKHTLSNGLTVYLSPNHETPRFYAEIVTRAGSKHDPMTNTGLAHYLEHLLFKGTSSFGTIDYAQEKPLLDEIAELYEKRSVEENETKRKRFTIRSMIFPSKHPPLQCPMKWTVSMETWAEKE